MHHTHTFSLGRVAALLFSSGLCALIYQVAWFRELRLIFGASTAASAAVLGTFMGGLGLGGIVLGKRADSAANALRFYAHLELGVALTAAVTPGLVLVAQFVYLSLGGSAVLGSGGATALRLLLTTIVLGPTAFLMGGTLPAAARAVGRKSDAGRQRVATLYGINTLGAVTGTVAANFTLIEVFGTRLTLWLACLLNVLVAVVARALSRSAVAEDEDAATAEEQAANAQTPDVDKRFKPPARLAWFPPVAAAIAGVAFMLMELVWYRMLAPLLGGSSYTFGLILALALVGIGLGGLAYSRTNRPATLSLFALTCALEALALAIPFALGDRLALLALLLRPLAQVSFGASILAWTLVAGIVVLPAAFVSGYQFPIVIGLYGRGSKHIAHHVGHAYLANTIGSILGSLGGGFGLLPLLSAPRCWQLVTVLLIITALVAVALELNRKRRLSLAISGSIAVLIPALLLLLATGPTHVWRHSGIGAGRADLPHMTRRALEDFVSDVRADILWEADGLESSVAISRRSGLTFVVNGKVDGSILADAGTQVMGGLLPSLLHGSPASALIIGLGTGTTAGWLGLVPSMKRVDVIELEPSIERVARECALANGSILDNPKVHISHGDARELLRTTKERYDIIFSEPSNPYRAGISSLYTLEFYRSALDRLHDGGLFVQWIQLYEIDPVSVATAAVTLHRVFPNITMWQTQGGDLLLVASHSPLDIDLERIRELLLREPYATAIPSTWRTTSAEGVLAHFVAGPNFVEALTKHDLGLVNTDDQNVLEFAFARNVGTPQNALSELRTLARRLDIDRPDVLGHFDPELLAEEQINHALLTKDVLDLGSERALLALGRTLKRLESGDPNALADWTALGRTPRTLYENMLVSKSMAHAGDDRADSFFASAPSETDRALLQGIWHTERGQRDQAIAALERGLLGARTYPWTHAPTMFSALSATVRLAKDDAHVAERFALVLLEPFAVEGFRSARLDALVALAVSSRNTALCVRAIDSIGVLPPRQLLYEARATCYREAGDLRLGAAERALIDLISPTLPFGAEIPAARSATSTPLEDSSGSMRSGSTRQQVDASDFDGGPSTQSSSQSL